MTAPISCVVLADGNLGSALKAARLLHRHGVDVAIGTPRADVPVFESSNAVIASAQLDPTDAGGYVASLNAWATTLPNPSGRPVPVLPLSDRLADWLDQGRDLLSPPLILALPESHVLRPLLDKTDALSIAERAGLDVLPWRRVATATDIPAVASLGLPVIVRPTSHATSGTEYLKQVVFDDLDSLKAFLATKVAEGAVLVVQPFLSVQPTQVEFAIVARASAGSVVSLVTGRKRAQSAPDGGVLTWGEAVDLPDVAEACRRFVETSGFHGSGGLEVIRDAGRLWFVEFNPRPEGIHALADLAGAPNLWPVVADLANLSTPEPAVATHEAALWVETAWLNRLRTDPWAVAGLGSALAGFRRHRHRSWSVVDRRDVRPALAYGGLLARAAAARLGRYFGSAS